VANYVDQVTGFLRGRWAVLSRTWNHPINRGSRIIAIRDYLIWNAVRFSMDARHVVQLPAGLEIILGKRENYGSAVYTHFLSDYSELLFLAHCLRPEDLFADVGANVGMYSIWVAGSAGAHAICFEPVPETFLALKQNIRLNGLDRLIDPHQVAIGDVPGEVVMTANRGGLDHVIDATSHADGDARVRVMSKTLDAVLGERTPFALKIDVEGFEFRVLNGGKLTLANPTLKVVLIEVQDWTLHKFGSSEQDVLSALTSFGFEPVIYDPANRVLTPGLDKSSLNYLLIRSGDRSEINSRLLRGPRVSLPGRLAGI
jgi:FkbM family methyltransferase